VKVVLGGSAFQAPKHCRHRKAHHIKATVLRGRDVGSRVGATGGKAILGRRSSRGAFKFEARPEISRCRCREGVELPRAMRKLKLLVWLLRTLLLVDLAWRDVRLL